MLAWVLLTGTIVHPGEVAAIMQLDRVWLSDQAKQELARNRK
jgi:hypothetical protein